MKSCSHTQRRESAEPTGSVSSRVCARSLGTNQINSSVRKHELAGVAHETAEDKFNQWPEPDRAN